MSEQQEYESIINSDEFEFRYDCGLILPGASYMLYSREDFINAIITHFTVVSVSLK